jgi:protein-serine/threonine kinase
MINLDSSVSVTCIEPPNTEIPPYSPSPSYSVVRKLSSVFLNAPSTVVHRTQFKSRPSLKSHDRGMIDINLDGSPSSTSHSSSGKSSTAPRVESTGKTSLDSKISMKSKGLSQHSSENKKLQVEGGGSHENALTPIAEVDMMDPEPIPSKCPVIDCQRVT